MHWMLHIRPENLEWFKQSLTARVKRQFGVDQLPEGTIDVRTAYNPEGLKLYLTKTLEPRYARAWGIKTAPSGYINGRKIWTSLNLGPAHWMPRRDAYRASQRF